MPSPTPDREDDGDIWDALTRSRKGSDTAKATLSSRARAVVLVVVALFALSILVNGVVTVMLVSSSQDAAVERAERARLDGAAQSQARRALADAGPAQDRLVANRLFRLPLPTPATSPASQVIANASSTQVLADMDPRAIVREDYVALGAAVRRFYARQPVVTQSGPTEITVTQLCAEYMQVAAKLWADGRLDVP